MKKRIGCIFIYLFFVFGLSYAFDDPWGQLRDQYKKKQINKVVKKTESPDPWSQLRAVCLPFSLKEEQIALGDTKKAKRFVDKFRATLLPYDAIIKKASQRFDIPEEVINAVIMAESGGNPYARAGTTSAKGLMQTIDSTFTMARTALEKEGILLTDNPFDPQSSIMAGTWYLKKMYETCIRDKKIKYPDKHDISTWRYPLEYYYAGPRNGVKQANKIYVFSNGKRRMIDKRAYSNKVQKWAKILKA
ncbi:MAG: transglycosylase SLT domain-containing protein [Desulfobacteraceae bacterium]|nr:transglycosylase SLT domain-containing protein [Desulfobacteraceae bacterium]